MSAQSSILLNKIISNVVKAGASRLHLEVGGKPIVRVDQKLLELTENEVIFSEFLNDVVAIILSQEERAELEEKKAIITTYTFEGGIRFKVHVFYQKNTLSMIFTYIPSTISDPLSIGLSQQFIDLVNSKNGLLVIGGYHGSGRTSTVLSLLNYVNSTQSKYILTIEDPIEYILTSNKSIIEQREIGRDARHFLDALKFCQESDVDIVFLSSLNDYQVLKAVIELIGSGRLVIVIVEASSVANAIANLVELVPEAETDRMRHTLADSLLGVVVQQLVPRRGGGEITASEILISNSASMALIKEGRYSQILSVIQTSREEGMQSLDQSLLEYIKTGEIDYEEALKVAVDKIDFQATAQKFRSAK